MIASFADKETEKLWSRQFSRKSPTDFQETAVNKLRLLNAAVIISDLHSMRIAIPPTETDAPLSVDADTLLSLAPASSRFPGGTAMFSRRT